MFTEVMHGTGESGRTKRGSRSRDPFVYPGERTRTGGSGRPGRFRPARAVQAGPGQAGPSGPGVRHVSLS